MLESTYNVQYVPKLQLTTIPTSDQKFEVSIMLRRPKGFRGSFLDGRKIAGELAGATMTKLYLK